jgi:hypothetical protein
LPTAFGLNETRRREKDDPGAKFAIGATALALLAVGIELAYLHHERSLPTKQAAVVDYGPTEQDDLVFLKKERPSSMADLKDLYGKTIWVSAGGQMEYYPAAGHHADYAKSAGTLLGADPMIVKDAFEQVAPKAATFRIPGGDRQVLLSFTLPKSTDAAKVYSVPVGYQQGKDFTFYTDELFFYDDPHVLYQHWGEQVWQAVDSHQVILGMSEREVELALGQVSKSVSNEYGNRLVVFANLGHPMAVTFVKNHVTAFRPDQGF